MFVDKCSNPISRTVFLTWLEHVLLRVGLDPTVYSGHSFRIGAATSAAHAKVPDHMIKTLGRWSSDCYTRYIRTPEADVRQALSSLARS